MFNYWGLTPEKQQAIDTLIDKQDVWELEIFKRDSGCWTFSLPLIKDEALTGGTDIILDQVFADMMGYEPHDGDSMYLTVSSKEIPNVDSIFVWDRPDPNFTDANFYINEQTGAQAWLCPVNQVLFGYVPKKLYVAFS